MMAIFRKWFGGETGLRTYEAAQQQPLAMSWLIGGGSANEEVKMSLRTVRERCREAERDNDYARAFLGLLENNVLGEGGINLQMKVKDPSGKMDELANDRIEWAWYKWGRPGSPGVERRLSWRDMQALVLRSLARDGEILIRKHAGWNGNKYAFALEIIEADFLDETYDIDFGAGRRVRMGVEIDEYNAPIAYHILGKHPGEPVTTPAARKRIPASEILHLFITERPGQVRGMPWLASALLNLKQIKEYTKAELGAARAGASKLGFIERGEGAQDFEGDSTDSAGVRQSEVKPLSITELPAGAHFNSWDPSHPNQGFGDFVKSCLRAVAGGLRVSYNSLASDLEGVNYSSIRAGLLEEREAWKCLQRFFIDHFCEPVFEEWLKASLAAGAIEVVNGTLPASKFDKFHAPDFRGRRWPWVDPLKDIEASRQAIAAGLTSRRTVIGDGGGDIYEVFAAQQADQELAKEMGLEFDTDKKGNERPQQGNPPAGTDD
jgi:lambda family phage portal protein